MSVFSRIRQSWQARRTDYPELPIPAQSTDEACPDCWEILHGLLHAVNSKLALRNVAHFLERRDCPLCHVILSIYPGLTHERRKSTLACEFSGFTQDGWVIIVYVNGGERGRIRVFHPENQSRFFLRPEFMADTANSLDRALLPWTRVSFGSLMSWKRKSLSPDSRYSSSRVTPSPKPTRSFRKVSSNFMNRFQDQISIPLVRGWLHDCEAHHHSTCSRAVLTERQGNPVDILLINVKGQRLVWTTSSTRYVALSYVWGRIDSFQTTKSTLKSLEDPGGLLLHSLPPVVQDALAFVKVMGETYLWIDQLCIVQDDADLKHRDIHQMDMIYSHACWTIVVLSGESADAYIPGIRPGSRVKWQSTTSVPLDKALENSPLEQRAWTMQERMLSQRCVYFTNQQVYFQCLNGVKSEVPAGIGQENLNGTTLVSNPLVSARLHQYDESWSWKFDIYRDLVQKYSRRQLSFPSDILNAFYGITKALQKCGSGDFVSGIPRSALNVALLWVPAAPLERRYINGRHLPSWSWAAWIGAVEWPSNIPRSVAVHCVTARCTLPFPELPMESEDAIRILARRTKDFDIRRSGLVPSQYVVYTKQGIRCGWVCGKDPHVFDHENTAQVEYVRLSSLLLEDLNYESATSMFDSAHYEITPRCIFNVMIVRWVNEDFKNAERVAICQIHKDAWKEFIRDHTGIERPEEWINLF
ncbi:HET-domain-containing protein [Lophium mytilinum]|uniref:HET-domain-containing protein n=1 Tax=Lophium mytilinum TaxID=390894 RepID=A0A6A6Q9Y7_9PEZI|nr:HET-domain-containing protein [Lophium mytilinum]